MIFGIMIILVAFLISIFGPRIFLNCCNCIDESCVQLCIEPPFYHRNETVTMNQAQNQATYDYESPTIQNNQHIGMTLSPTTSPSAPQVYSENSNKTCQRHANCQNSPQPLPRFHEPQTISSPTNQYNAHNDITLSPTSTLPLSIPLPSWAPPAYSENSNASCQILPQYLQTRDQYNEQNDTISSLTATEIMNGEWINGTWVQNDMTLSPTSIGKSNF